LSSIYKGWEKGKGRDSDPTVSGRTLVPEEFLEVSFKIFRGKGARAA